ncbi:unnamed protein product [Calypogeia fissa]
MEVLHYNSSEVNLHTAVPPTPYGSGADGDLQVEKSDGLEIPAEAYPVLHKLAKKWTDITGCRNLRLKPLKGAMTNQVFQCKWAPTKEGERSRKVLVRVYGESSELFFSRDDEMLTFERMSHNGQGPRLLARFPNGRVEEFLNARTLSAEDLRNPEISDKIAVKMRQFHELDMPGPAEPKLWERLSAWLQKTLELASPELKEKFRLNSLQEEIAQLEKRVLHAGEVIGFCHNDLQYGNIMIDEKDNAVTLIDYEYASFNPVALDIANHFCEMTANYHTNTPHVLDYSKYPDTKERLRFVRTYLEASGKPVPQSDVESLMKDLDLYALASHLHWAFWGFISALTSDIDFNFLEYARQRLDQYYLAKSTLLDSKKSS